jgi:hypothetical protein
MASLSYSTTCYSGIEAFKAVYDITRDGIPFQYCKGKNGFDKEMSLEDVIEKIAKPKRANFIVKTGPNAKWYVKKITPEEAHETLKVGKKYCTVKNPTAKCYVVEW